MMEAEGEGESLRSIMAAEGEEDWKLARESKCLLRNCECSWRLFCSPRIPRVAPGRDYSSIPAGADHRPAWSLLIGLKDGAVLRLKRLGVARSGRILGRSDDALEAFHDIKTPTGGTFDASAALAPDGRSLCVLRQDDGAGEQPHALHLTLQQPQTDTSPVLLHLPLPEIQGRSRSCMPISAAGHIWALCPIVEYGVKLSLLMRPLLPRGGGQWEQVGGSCPHKDDEDEYPWLAGGFLQGYAVLPGPLILVSFKQDGLFFTFAPGSRDWTPVLTDETRPPLDYVPILGRGVYMEQDKAIYMLRGNTIYAYKLSYIHQGDGDDQGRLRLDPPITIDSVSPFNSCHGCGFLTRLDCRLMCSVWISLAPSEQLDQCQCDNLHAIVTTFNLHHPAQGGIKVLHSSFRRVDMEPNPEDQEFCFLQEYEGKDSPVLLQHEGQGDLTSSQQHDDEPSNKLDCCRQFKMEDRPHLCFRCGINGHFARECSLPPQEPFSALPPCTLVGRASMQHRVPFSRRPVATTSINKDLFIICQAGSQPVIYHTGVMDESSLLEGGDDGKPLQPSCYVAAGVGDDDYWHFFLHSG